MFRQVPPAEVESVLLQHPAVGDCGVVGAPDEAAGELPTAFVVLKPGVNATAQEIIDFAASRVSTAFFHARSFCQSIELLLKVEC